MKKLVIGLVAIAAAVFVGMPFVTGKVAETESVKLIDSVNDRYSHIGAINIVNYDRGLMKSNAEYAFEFTPALQETIGNSNIEYNCEVDHGITGVSYTCQLANEGQFKEFLDEFLQGEDPVLISGNISAFGKIDQTVSVKPLAIELETGEKVSVPELASITAKYDQSGKEIDFSGAIPKVLVEGQTFFDLNGVTVKGLVSEAREGLYVGNINWTGASLKAGDDKGTVGLSEVKLAASTLETGQTIASSFAFASKSLEFPSPSGETETFTDGLLDFGIYGMDTDALVEYIEVNKQMQKRLMAADDQGQAALGSMTELFPALEKLLKPGFGFNVKSSFKSGNSANSLALDLSLVNDFPVSQMMSFLFAPDEALKNFKGILNVDFSKELLEKYPTLAISVASLPLFVQSEQGVTLDVKIDSGLIVNGEATSVEELQSLFR